MKKMVSLVVALAMLLLLLCACGQTEEPQNSPEVQNTGEPVADESEGFTIGFANVFVGNTWRAVCGRRGSYGRAAQGRGQAQGADHHRRR